MLFQDLNLVPLLMLNKITIDLYKEFLNYFLVGSIIFSYHAVFLIMLLQMFSLERQVLFKLCEDLAGVMFLYG